MASVTEKLMTADEFFRMQSQDDGLRYELVRGVLESTCLPGFRHGRCQLRIGGLLQRFAEGYRLGRVVGSVGLITERDPDTVRGPDVAFWSFNRLPEAQNPIGYPEQVADLCVEILSPRDNQRNLVEKVQEYVTSGVHLVWVADPNARTVEASYSSGQSRVYRENELIDAGDVLPGFSYAVAEFFA